MSQVLNSALLRILLVEDDEDDRDSFHEAVESLNIPHQIVFAKSCEQLVNYFDQPELFDLIFMDINLPGIDGKNCLEQIKKNEMYKHIPVIMFTGSHSDQKIDETYKNGAHYYIVKPYAHLNYIASLKMVFEINWKETPPRPSREDFLVNLTFN